MNALQQFANDLAATDYSRPVRIAQLAVGETEAIVKRLPFDNTTRASLSEEIGKIKSTMIAAVARAKKRCPGQEYVTEVGDMRTRDGEILIVVAATRTE